jgi:hypothetical protein
MSACDWTAIEQPVDHLVEQDLAKRHLGHGA